MVFLLLSRLPGEKGKESSRHEEVEKLSRAREGKGIGLSVFYSTAEEKAISYYFAPERGGEKQNTMVNNSRAGREGRAFPFPDSPEKRGGG